MNRSHSVARLTRSQTGEPRRMDTVRDPNDQDRRFTLAPARDNAPKLMGCSCRRPFLRFRPQLSPDHAVPPGDAMRHRHAAHPSMCWSMGAPFQRMPRNLSRSPWPWQGSRCYATVRTRAAGSRIASLRTRPAHLGCPAAPCGSCALSRCPALVHGGGEAG
jgi:hypothetical protein